MQGRIHWHQHALERFLERGITRAEVIVAIEKGEVIEVYEKDQPFSSCLMFYVDQQPIHVVTASDSKAHICHVITAYRPTLEYFESDLKTRRKR